MKGVNSQLEEVIKEYQRENDQTQERVQTSRK